MCIDSDPRLSQYPPEIIMAELVQKKLGFPVTPEELRFFVARHWGVLALLGHRIHQQEERTIDLPTLEQPR